MADGPQTPQGPETPTPVGPEARGPQPTPPPQETLERQAAKAKAAELQETAEEKGPGEAYEELAAGHLAGERIANQAADKVYGEELGRPDLSPAQSQVLEGEQSKVQAGLERVQEMEGELSKLSGNLGGVIAQKEAAATPTEPELRPAPPAPEAGAPPLRPEEPVTPQPEAAAAGGVAGGEQPPTPPDVGGPAPGAEQPEGRQPEQPPGAAAQPPGEEAVVDQVTAAAQEAARARREWLDELRELDQEELSDAIEDKKIEVQTYRQASVDPRIRPEQRDHYKSLKDIARSEQRDMRRVQKERFGEETAGGSGDKAAEERAEAQREARERIEYAAKLAKMTPEERTAERLSLVSAKEAVEETLSGQLTQTLREAYNKQLQDADVKLKALDKVTAEKAPEEQKKVEEKEKAKTEAEERKAEEEMVKLRAETATIEDLPFFRSALKKLRDENAEDRKNLLDLENKIKDATDPQEKERLDGERKTLREKLTRGANMQKVYEEGYKTASQRAREEASRESALSPETLREMSPAEFEKLSDEEKAKYLQEGARAYGRPTATEIANIRTKVEAGTNLSQKEMMQFTRWASDSLMTKGANKGEIMGIVNLVGNQYREVSQAILSRVVATEAAQQALREKFPSNWERVLKFAKDHPGWAMILLLILAGVIAGPVSVAAAAAQFGTSKKGLLG